VSSLRPPVLLLVISLGAFLGVYAVALGTVAGLELDARGVVQGFDAARLPRVHAATEDLLRTIDVSSLALIGGGIVLLALLRGAPRFALGAAAILGGANLTTQLLKPLLSRLDPLGAEASRIPETFPSGHATVAMSLALAAVLVSPPGLRLLVALIGAGYALLVGIALLALGWHYPSDVAGGYLVASIWASLALLLVSALPARPSSRRSRPGGLARGAARAMIAIVMLGMLVAGASVVLDRRAAVLEYGRARTTFFVASAVLALLAALVVGSLLWATGRQSAPARGQRLPRTMPS